MRNYIDLITEDRQNQRLIENFEHAGKIISEAKLTPDQIGQIFKGIEQNMTAAGGNRTAVGKGVDTAKSAAGAVGKAYSGLIDKFSNTSVMKGFDAAYDKAAEQLKQATGGDQGAMQYVQKYRDFAKKHPMAQSAIYALLIAAVSIGSGGAAAPAALGLLKMGDRLVQGDKFSQALAKGATTGAAAAVGQGIKGALSGQQVPSSGYSRTSKLVNKFSDFSDTGDVSDTGTSGTAKAIQAAQSSNLTQQDTMNDFAKKMGLTGDSHKAVFKGGVPVEIDGKPVPQNLYTPDQAQNVAAAKKMAAQMANPTADNTGYELKKGADGLEGPIVSKNGRIVGATSSTGNFESVQLETRAIQAATYNFNWIALPATMMVDYKKSYQPDYLGESTTISGTVLTREGIDCVFSNLERLHEHLVEAESEYGAEVKKPGIFGRLGAGIKQAAGAVAGSKLGQTVGQGVQAVKTAANNATTQVTADKLQKAWQANRSPMDTKGLMNFLMQQGVDKSVIAATYKSLGIPLQTGGRQKGQGPSQTANAIRKRDARAANKAAPGTNPSADPGVAIQQEKPAGQPHAQFGQQWTAQATAAPKPQTPQTTNTSGNATANFGAVGAQQEQPKKKKVSKRLEV